MRLIKSLLIALFAVVLAIYVYSEYRISSSGVKEGPSITVEEGVLEVSVNDPESVLLSGVTAYDELDGSLTDEILVSGVSKLLSDNTAKVTYLVFDSHDNLATATRSIKYTDYRRPEISINKPLIFPSKDVTGIISYFNANDVIDGDISDDVRISSLVPSSEPSLYYISVQVMNSMGDSAKVKLPVIIATDSSAPVITLSSYLEYVETGSEFDPMAYLSSVNYKGNELSHDSVVMKGELDVNTPGTYHLFFECTAENHTGRTALTVSVR